VGLSLSLRAAQVNMPEVNPVVENQSTSLSGVSLSGQHDENDTVTVSVNSGSLTMLNTANITFLVGNGTDDMTMSFSGDLASVNGALASLSYTPTTNYSGAATLTISTTGVEPDSQNSSLMVNASVNIEAARDQLLAGVTSLSDPVGAGPMIAYGTTSFIVSHYAGDKTSAMIAAATWGSGKVVAMPDHQWIGLGQHGGHASTATFYRNTMSWLSGSTSKTINVVTYNNQANYDWLIADGYTNVTNATNANLTTALTDADVFIAGWLGSNPDQSVLDATADYTRAGGGLFICDYGPGYQWWWGKKGYEAPGNILLREPGIGFSYGSGGAGSLNIDRATIHVSAAKALVIMSDPTSYTEVEQELAAEIFMKLGRVLPTSDPLLQQRDGVYELSYTSVTATPDNPVSLKTEQALLLVEAEKSLLVPLSEMVPHRSAEDVFGAIPAGAARVTKTITMNTGKARWLSTGLYVAPGEIATVTVPSSIAAAGYVLRVGGNVDDISRRDSWARHPFGCSRSFSLNATTVEIGNPFGGLIYIETGSEADTNPSFDATFTNVLEAPYFILGETTNAEWVGGVRNNPAPYAEMVCDGVIISLPSSMIRNVSNPHEIMTYWNDVVTRMDYVGGFEDLRQNAERINVDVQISVGLLHAGYPIQGPDWASEGLMDYNQLMTVGDWGYFHELGHEMQRRPDKKGNYYTFSGDVEVTVNIFANAALELKVPNAPPEGWGYSVDPCLVMQRALTAVSEGGTFDSKSNPYPFYFQLADGFGWDTYRAVFQTYHDDLLNNPSALPTNNQERKDQWFLRWSQTAGVNMKKFMVDQWGLTVSQSALDQVAGLPDWLPATGCVHDVDAPSGITSTVDLGGETQSYDGTATIGIVTQPANGTLTDNGDGTWDYQADEGFVGTDSFSYEVISSTGHISIVVVVIEVGQPLFGWWKLDETAQTTAADSSGHNKHGTVNGGAVWTTGKVGGSLLFDGVDDRIVMPTTAALVGQTDFTISAWVKVDPAAGSGVLIQQRQPSAEDPNYNGYDGEYIARVLDAGQVEFLIYNGGNQFNLTSTATVNDSQWHRVTIMRNGLTGKIFIDGVEDVTATGTAIKSLNPLKVVVGQDYRDGNQYFQGGIDDIRIYSYALEPDAILDLSNQKPGLTVATYQVDASSNVGDNVVTVDAQDPDGDTLSYAITGGDPNGDFAISQTGVISVAKPLDAMTQDSYELEITITDDGSPAQSVTETITINLETTNSAPYFNSTILNKPTVEVGVQVSGSLVSDSGDPDIGDVLSYSKLSGPAWLTVNSDGSYSGTPGQNNIGENTFLVEVKDSALANASATLSITVIEAGSLSSDVSPPTGQVQHGTAVGSIGNTLISDDSYLQLTERIKSRRSSLSYDWTFNITEPGSTVLLQVEAYHTANSEGDNFRFKYSTDGSNFTNALLVTKTSDDNATQSFELAGLSGYTGIVTVRVIDTDNTRRNDLLDTLYVDFLNLHVTSDVDGDKILDSWELANFGDLTSADGTTDADGDAVLDQSEWVGGTNPLSATDYLHISGMSNNGTEIGVTWASIEGRIYSVEYSLDLTEWNVLQAEIIGLANSTSVLDTDASRVNGAKIFYRVRVKQP